MKRRIKNSILLLLVSVFLGTVLLTIVFALPIKTARKHVEVSLDKIIGRYPEEEPGLLRKEIRDLSDSFTNALMVQNALEKVEGAGAFRQAMFVWHHDLVDDTTWLTEESLRTFLQDGTEGMYLKEYSKYWHGYLVWLKPLLMILPWDKVEVFLFIFQVLLLLAVCVVSVYKKTPYTGIGILVTFLFMKPLGVWFSLTLSVCWTIVLLAVLCLLLFYGKLEEKKLQDEFFLLVGILTSYNDFLTYPIVTLGIPVCVYLILDSRNFSGTWKRFKKYFWMCACWAAGYVGMWGMKWIVAELFCHSGTLRNAVWSVIYRTGPLDGYQSAFSGIPRTWRAVMGQYDSLFYKVLFGIMLLCSITSAIKCAVTLKRAGEKKGQDLEKWLITVVSLAVVMLFPVLWMSLTQNHTAIHCMFTFRIMGVGVMALNGITACSLGAMRD